MHLRSQNQTQWDFAQHGRLFFYGTSASCKSNHFVRYSELDRTGLAPAAPVVSNSDLVAVTPSAADSERVDSMRVNAATRSAQKGAPQSHCWRGRGRGSANHLVLHIWTRCQGALSDVQGGGFASGIEVNHQGSCECKKKEPCQA